MQKDLWDIKYSWKNSYLYKKSSIFLWIYDMIILWFLKNMVKYLPLMKFFTNID